MRCAKIARLIKDNSFIRVLGKASVTRTDISNSRAMEGRSEDIGPVRIAAADICERLLGCRDRRGEIKERFSMEGSGARGAGEYLVAGSTLHSETGFKMILVILTFSCMHVSLLSD